MVSTSGKSSAIAGVLSGLSGVERSSYEHAYLPGDDALSARALRGAELTPAGLWSRRLRISLRGAPLLTQEAFLPAIGTRIGPTTS